MRTLRLPIGRSIPVLGQGTWLMGEDRARRKTEVAALRLGLDLGMNAGVSVIARHCLKLMAHFVSPCIHAELLKLRIQLSQALAALS